MSRLRDIRLGDPVLFALVAGLSIFGIAMIYSAGVLDVPSTIVAGLWRQQLLWFVLAMVATPFVLRVPVIWLEWAAQPAYALALVLLVLVLFIGTGAGTAASVSGWLRVGPIGIQPSELAKIAVVLMLARVLGEWREPPKTLWQLWKPIAVVLVPMGLVMAQPDLGTALVFSSVLLFMLFWAGTPLPMLFFLISPVIGLFLSINPWIWGGWMVLLALILFARREDLTESLSIWLVNFAAGSVSWLLWDKLAQYQKNRFLAFLDPSIDPRGASYNLVQSRVAIGSGGWLGKGFTLGTQKRLAFLPEQHTDFIFSVVGEEWGFIGVALVLLAFGLIFWRLVRVSEKSSDPFASLVPFGIFGSWFAHVLVNTGMTVGIMPITGIPLPFISYGGSFLLVNLLAMAIVQRIAAEAGSG
ncbi:MAG TPA: rod shape-determining protein RodA [Longimicrobiaceae bacterium]|jgi:rod shape determining protein RodA|nr:rod shape-determining protein RodA [Longimicrobiaceae bacterium]